MEGREGHATSRHCLLVSHVSQNRTMRLGRNALAILAFSAIILLECSEGAKKKKKTKNKLVKSHDILRCGVCFTVVDEVLYELRKTENSTSTLDLRWGLTAEVTEGRAKRIGKVIPYKRSQLRAIEIMEKICDTMKDYGKFGGVPGEIQLKRSFRREDDTVEEFEQKNQNLQIKMDRDDQKKFERICEELVEENEALITDTIRDELNATAMEDIICFGSSSAPCGLHRTSCHPGSFSDRNGTIPCNLCGHGKYQSESGQIHCAQCGENENTTDRGSNSSSSCLKQCKPGTFSAGGLEPCYDCGIGTYQPSWGSKSCERCETGLGTNAVGSVYITECVSVCGDYRKSLEEQCDDGNLYPGDGCSEKCAIEAGHACSAIAGQVSSCNKVICGDDKLQNSWDGNVVEQCDDNNTVDGDGCSSVCLIEPGWACSTSPRLCSKVVCGDGVRQDSADGLVKEWCDDGNSESGDGCSAECQVEENFMCDGPSDGRHNCHRFSCGDGFVESIGQVAEQCDDSNLLNGDGCNDKCEVEAGWECQEGSARWGAFAAPGLSIYSRNNGGCIRKEICGDGFRVRNEKCDDGNTADGDGCSSGCTIEEGFTCSARGSGTGSDSPPTSGEALPDICEKRNEASSDNSNGSVEVKEKVEL